MPDAPVEIAIVAIRCWRAARDAGAPVQRRLYAALAHFEAGVLAPVFDALLVACEAALGRRLEVGTLRARSADERLVVALLDGSEPTCGCTPRAASMLDGAVRSAQIMLSLTMVRI